jgi:ubiquinone/menaquinone biosynthesis C-methylase UbiE
MARKPNFTRKKKRNVHGATFWDQEYTSPSHLKLSTGVSGDLEKFIRWHGRQKRMAPLFQAGSSVLDAGCGNGRNLIYLAVNYGLSGVGIDISSAAVAQAKKASADLPLTYHVGSTGEPLPAADESQDLALDMMTSHFLNAAERTKLRDELWRVLKPGGWLFMKTFLKDEDQHTARLLRDHPGTEPGTYIHPVMGVSEYVYSEEALVAFLGERFIIRKVSRSHRHRGKGGKRRTISVYAEKDYR